MTDDERIEAACAWSDYRSEYGADATDYKAFMAGWLAGHHGDQSSVLR